MHQPALEIAKQLPQGRWIGLMAEIARFQITKPARRRLKAARTFFFAAYAREDYAKVRPVFDLIEGDGHLLWVDRVNLQPGGVWTADIVAAIRGSKAMLVFCSAAAFASRDIHREVAAAARFRKPILPILLDDTLMPDNFVYYLSVHEAIKLSDIDWRERLSCATDALANGRKNWRGSRTKNGEHDCPPILVTG